LHIGGTRRVILAHMDRALKENYIKNVKLEKRTKYTFTNKNKLREEPDLIQDRGYALSYGETTEGTAGISVPLFGMDGVEASLSIATPDVRLSSERIPKLALLLKKHAKEISKKLG